MGENVYPKGVIVLRVHIHCGSCENEVIKCLRGFDGVEGIKIDANDQKVTVNGENADPIKIAKRLRKKTGKHVEIIHPIPIVEEEKKEVEPPPPEVVEVVLKINIHCEACAREVKYCIHGMEGVQTVVVEMEKNEVKVKGTMDPQKLVELFTKKSGRHAEIVKPDEKGDECCKEGEQCCCYSFEHVYAPQIFSDENPNACSVM